MLRRLLTTMPAIAPLEIGALPAEEPAPTIPVEVELADAVSFALTEEVALIFGEGVLLELGEVSLTLWLNRE